MRRVDFDESVNSFMFGVLEKGDLDESVKVIFTKFIDPRMCVFQDRDFQRVDLGYLGGS